MNRVDLNSDLGESFGTYHLGMDAEILSYVTSANVACGFHAGDPIVMERTVRLAGEKGVSIGAHPGYPDLQGFGRRNMQLSPDEARAMVIYQVGALQAFLAAHHLPLQHVKLHGALYNTAAASYDLSLAICKGILAVAPEAVFLGLSGSQMLVAARDAGLKVAGEVFADRAYHKDGSLVSRKEPGSVLHDPKVVIARTVRMVREGVVESIEGDVVPVEADSICVHGDTPEAVAFVREISEALKESGIQLLPLGA